MEGLTQQENRVRASDRVVRLASLIGSFLAGQPVTAQTADAEFVRFAASRHGVGHMLLAASTGRDPALDAMHRERRSDLARRQAVELLLLGMIDARFAEKEIPWIVLKGAPQASLLYDDPRLRPSSDIDVLVPPAHFVASLLALKGLGWRSPDVPTRGLGRIALHLMRDVGLRAPGASNIKLELHQRPLFGEPFGQTGADLFDAAERNPLPAPAFGPALAYYSFAHGALCYWVRLKWLVDFAQVVARLDANAFEAVLAQATARRTCSSLAASALLVAELFPHTEATAAVRWAAGQRANRGVEKRLARYRACLAAEDIRGKSPLYSREEALRANMLFHESLRQQVRVVMGGAITSVVRRASGFGHA